MPKHPVNIFWFRRDLRLNDNTGLFHALQAGLPVVPVFIFDRNILDKLQDRKDARVNFIHRELETINQKLNEFGSSLVIKYAPAAQAWQELAQEFDLKNVYTNQDYEPYARQRDEGLKSFFESKNIGFHLFKDQVIFEKEEVTKDDGKPYTVFTPYSRKWLQRFNEAGSTTFPSELHLSSLEQNASGTIPSLESMGFTISTLPLPDRAYQGFIADYAEKRNFPAIAGTSKIGIHLRFGTVSIRELVKAGFAAAEKTWLMELIWREFYFMILWHFPQTVNTAFKPEYDRIEWRNDEEEFKAWCEGRTGYPIVDAGMRELNATGFMHNRVRMITASFLTKHLLIDWRWGEAYFAKKLLDYEQASNVGGWQWAASCGNDAAPYFRVFNPELQTQKFDPKLAYIRKWIPELNDPFQYPKPIVEHSFARNRVLATFKKALEK
ncbi:MAG: cryptochrome/photolyase family protein [Sphingobacteriaceae bacterium]